MKIKFSSFDRIIVKGYTVPLRDVSQINISAGGVDITTMTEDDLNFSGNPGEILTLCTGKKDEKNENKNDIIGETATDVITVWRPWKQVEHVEHVSGGKPL